MSAIGPHDRAQDHSVSPGEQGAEGAPLRWIALQATLLVHHPVELATVELATVELATVELLCSSLVVFQGFNEVIVFGSQLVEDLHFLVIQVGFPIELSDELPLLFN